MKHFFCSTCGSCRRNKVMTKISEKWLVPEITSWNCESYWTTSWLNKTSLSKYCLSVAFFVLSMHRYHWSLKSSRNKSKVCQIFFFSFERPHTNQLCPHPQNSPFASISLQRPVWTQSKARILLLPPPPPSQRKVLNPFCLFSLSAPLSYRMHWLLARLTITAALSTEPALFEHFRHPFTVRPWDTSSVQAPTLCGAPKPVPAGRCSTMQHDVKFYPYRIWHLDTGFELNIRDYFILNNCFASAASLLDTVRECDPTS